MNRQIAQLFGLVSLLFALLVGFTSYWAVLDASGLEDNPNNRRPLLQEQKIPRGRILASDNRTVLARSVPHGRGEDRVYSRVYPSAACSPTRSATRSCSTAGARSSSPATKS